MSDRRLIPIAALLLVAAGQGGPRIFVEQPEMDFGRVDGGRFVEHCFAIENRGGAALGIKRVDAGCDSVSWQLETNSIRPGGCALLAVSTDTGNAAGFLDRRIAVVSDDPARPVLVLLLKATVAPRFELQPGRVDFGELEGRGVSVSRDVLVRAAAPGTGALESAESSSPRFKAALRRVSPGRGEYLLSVETVPPLDEGWNRAVVTATGPAGDSCSLAAQAYAPPEFAVAPACLMFEARDGKQERILFVRQHGVRSSALVDVAAPFDRAGCEVIPGPGGFDYRVVVAVSGLSGMGGVATNMALTFDAPRGRVLVPVVVGGKP